MQQKWPCQVIMTEAIEEQEALHEVTQRNSEPQVVEGGEGDDLFVLRNKR